MDILTKIKKILGKNEEKNYCIQEKSTESKVRIIDTIDIKELRGRTEINRIEMMERYYEYYKDKINRDVVFSASNGNFSSETVFEYGELVKGDKIEVDKESVEFINELISIIVPELIEKGFKVNVSKEEKIVSLNINWE